MHNNTKNSNLNYSIDLTVTKVNRLFVSMFENENDWLSFKVSIVQIEDLNVLVDGKSFF